MKVAAIIRGLKIGKEEATEEQIQFLKNRHLIHFLPSGEAIIGHIVAETSTNAIFSPLYQLNSFEQWEKKDLELLRYMEDNFERYRNVRCPLTYLVLKNSEN